MDVGSEIGGGGSGGGGSDAWVYCGSSEMGGGVGDDVSSVS